MLTSKQKLRTPEGDLEQPSDGIPACGEDPGSPPASPFAPHVPDAAGGIIPQNNEVLGVGSVARQ